MEDAAPDYDDVHIPYAVEAGQGTDLLFSSNKELQTGLFFLCL